MIICNTCYGQQTRILITQKSDTFFIWHQYATITYLTSPPQYDGYINVMCDTLFSKDSLLIKQIQDRQKRRLEIVSEFYQHTNFVNIDSVPIFSQDTGTTTIGIITSKKHYDTLKCKALIKNLTTSKIIAAQIYIVRKQFKYTEPREKPKYYYEDIGYLGQDKKPLPTNLKVIQSEELK